MDESRQQGFTQGIGRWIGLAEAYDDKGALSATPPIAVVQQQVGENRVRIDLSFVGPFKFAGHYFIEDCRRIGLSGGRSTSVMPRR